MNGMKNVSLMTNKKIVLIKVQPSKTIILSLAKKYVKICIKFKIVAKTKIISLLDLKSVNFYLRTE